MMATLALQTAIVLLAAPRAEAVVPAGERLEVNLNPRGGAIRIETWEREEVAVSGRYSDAIRLEVKPGATVEVQEIRPAHAALERTEYHIRIPSTMAVTVVSDDAHVEIRGSRAGISVNVNHGSVEAYDVVGPISLDASTAGLLVERCTGDAVLDTERGDITVRGLVGNLEAENVRGDVLMEDVEGPSVRVTSNSGTISYRGEIRADGTLDLASQTGAIVFAIPESSSASFELGTVGGRFSTEFDLDGVQPVRGESFAITIGSGGAKVKAITYTGDIHIAILNP